MLFVKLWVSHHMKSGTEVYSEENETYFILFFIKKHCINRKVFLIN